MLTTFAPFLVVCAGISVAFQQVLNASLRVQLGSPWWAGFISYLVGCVAMFGVALMAPGPGLTFAGLTTHPSSWLLWLGGLFGAFFIAVSILMVPRLGAAYVICLIVVGQMVGSIAFDHFGLFGLAEHPVTLTKVVGACLLIAGVILVRP